MKTIHLHHNDRLPDGVLLSVQGVSKAPPLPLPQPPRWLARLLPGVQWSARTDGARDREDFDDFDDEDDIDDYDPDERTGVAFKEFSFDVAPGQGVGLVGPDYPVTQLLLFMITGFVPPSTGSVQIRGRIAPVLKPSALNIAGKMGKDAVRVTGMYLDWPADMTRGRKWDEIVKFARLDEVTEYPKGSIEYDNLVTRRLIQSASLHLDDATVYLVGHNFARDSFAERCYEVLEQRLKDGCAIVQNAVEVEEVSRLCHEAIYVDAGAPLFRGRLGEVVKFALERPKEKTEGAAAVPVRALLLGDGVEIGTRGGKIEVELDVFKKDLELDLAMLFTDEVGHETRIEQSESFVAPEPGIYQVTIAIPGGLLGYSSYKAALLAADTDSGAGEHPLLSFEFVSHSAGPGPATDFELDLEGIPEGEDGVTDASADVEWNVHRVGA